MSIKIINAGMLSTIQDSGRFGVMKNGFTQSGAMDLRSLKVANLLVGNNPECAAIEMTMGGITAELDSDCVIALSGGDFGAKINDTPIRTNKAYPVKSGDILTMGFAKSGARAYLAVSGGIDVPAIMGSRSTNLKSEIGGLEGRKLKAGDVLKTGNDNTPLTDSDIKHRELEPWELGSKIAVRAVLGPQDYMFTDDDIISFFTKGYKVTPSSDRMGIRLEGTPMKSKGSVDIISDGIVFGSVQIPKNGMPIILTADHQTTGGYAKIATVISTDLPLLAQAKAGDTIRFYMVSAKKAEAIARKEKKFFDKLFK